MRQPLYAPNSKYLNIKEINADFDTALVPEQTIFSYDNAVLTPINQLIVKGRYIPPGLLNTYDKELKHLKKLYLKLKFQFFTKIEKHKGTFLFAHNLWSSNYYHWFCETLPRLYMMHKTHVDGIIILPENLIKNEFITNSLDCLNLKHVLIDSFVLNQFSKLIMVKTYPPLSGNVNPWLQIELRNTILHSLHNKLNRGISTKLYISRSKAQYRRIENEDEVIAAVQRFGYYVLYAEDLTFVDQVQYFHQASSIISVHGAGLTNIMYMPSGSQVMEIRNSSWDWDTQPLCYWRLANILSLKWSYHHAQSVGAVSNFSNITVDINKFMRDLEAFDIN